MRSANSSRISVRILIVVVLTVISVTGLSSIVDLYRNFQKEKQELGKQAESIANRLATSVSYPLWNLNREGTEDVLSHEIESKMVTAIFVYDEHSELYTGKFKTQDGKVRTMDSASVNNVEKMPFASLARDVTFKNTYIGAIKLYVTDRYLWMRLGELSTEILLKLIVLIISLSLVLFLALRAMVIRPLEALREWVTSTGTGQAALMPRFSSSGEIDVLATSFEEMASNVRQNTEALRRNEELFRAVVEDQTEMIVRWKPDGTRTFVNEAYCRAFGRSRENLIGTSFFPLIAEPYRATVIQRLRLLTPESPVSSDIHESMVHDGEKVWQEWTDRGIFDEDGNLIELQSVGRDITDRKENEQKIRNQENLLRRVMDANPNLIFIKNWEGQYVLANIAMAGLYATTPENMIGKTDADFNMNPVEVKKFTEDDREVMMSMNPKFIAEEPATHQQTGEMLWYQTIKIPFSADNGAKQILGVATDITVRKNTREALHASEAHYRALVENTPDIIAGFDRECRYLFINSAIRSISNLPPAEFVGKTMREVGFSEDQVVYRENMIRRVFASRMPEEGEFEYEGTGGKGVYEWRVYPVLDSTGNVLSVFSINRDITQRKKSEEALRESESRYRTLYTMTPVMMHSIDQQGRLISVSDHWLSVMGYSREEVVGRKSSEFLSSASQTYATQVVLPAFMLSGECKDIEYQFVKKNGEIIDTLLSAISEKNAEGQVVRSLAVIVDITYRKKAEQDLRDSINRFELIARATNDAIWDWNASTDTVWWNDAARRVFGTWNPQPSEVHITWESRIHPDDKDRVLAKYRTTLAGTQNFWSDEFRFMLPDGSYGYFYDRAYILRDPGGKAIRVLGAMMDLTERKALEQNLIQSQKTESIGRMAGGIAHDINNMLAVILPTAEMLLTASHEPGTIQKFSDVIVSAAKRASDIVKQVLVFARQTPANKTLLSLNDLVKETQKLLDRVLNKDIHVILDLSPDLPFVEADSTQVQQVLINLCVNARDAMNDWGTINVATRMFELTPDKARLQSGVEAGWYAELCVSDTGSGISEESLPKIFDAFFSTKDIGKGTGLGLAVVKSIVTDHNGFIDVQSRINEGTSMCIYLPIAKKQPPGVADVYRRSYVKGSGVILVVDDEALVLSTSQILFENLGYRVVTASSGLEAIDIFKKQKIDLVVLDIQMPLLDGLATLEELQKVNSGIKYILVTGSATERQLQKLTELPSEQVVYKPYDMEKISKLIQKVLAS